MKIKENQLRSIVRSTLLSEMSDRTGAGAAGQHEAGKAFQSVVPGLRFASIEKGSNLPDLELLLPDGIRIQAEVKSSSTGKQATAFDHTLGRDDSADPDLDPVADAIIAELGTDFVTPSGAVNGVFSLMNGTYKGNALGKYRGDSQVEVDPQVVALVDDANIKIDGGINGLTDGPLEASSQILGVVGLSDLAPGEEEKVKSTSRRGDSPEAIQSIRALWPTLEGNKNFTRKKSVFYALPAGSGPTTQNKLWLRDPDGDYYGMNQTDTNSSVTVGPNHPTLSGQVVDLTGSTIRLWASSAGLSYKDLPATVRTAATVKNAAFQSFTQHLKEGGDQLFVIVGPQGVFAWSVGTPIKVGNLTIKSLSPDSIAAAKLASYGTAGKVGQIRLGLDLQFDMSTATKIESLQESRIRKVVRETLILEANAGARFEANLLNGQPSCDEPCYYFVPPEGKTLKYDLGIALGSTEGGGKPRTGNPIVAKVEVKLDSSAQLGKLAKVHFADLSYTVGTDGSGKFSWSIKPEKPEYIKNFFNNAFEKLNSMSTSLKRMDDFCANSLIKKGTADGFYTPGDVVDLKTTHNVRSVNPATGEKPIKQVTSSSPDVLLVVDGSYMFNYLNHKDYFILGRGSDQPAGQICSLGGDPLGLGLGPIEFGEVQLEIKFGKKSRESHSFVVETRANEPILLDASYGRPFENSRELSNILNKSDVYSDPSRLVSFEDLDVEDQESLGLAAGKKYLRALIRESLLLEELTKSDKKEIERIARKQAQKEIEKAVGKDFAKSVQKEVEKVLKDKATKQEIADVTKSVVKKLYRQLSHNYPQIIDRIKV